MCFANDMTQIVLAILVFIYYMVSFFLLGYSFERQIRGYKEVNVPLSLVIGFFVYYLLFECVALPMKLLGCQLSSLTIIWTGTIIIILFICYIINRNFLKREIYNYINNIKYEIKWYLLFFLLVMLCFMIIINVTAQTMGVRDDSYYIADAMTSLATNSIQQYDCSTGKRLSSYVMMYFIPMYPMHGAVLGKLIHLHPIIENKWSSAISVLLLNKLVFYLLSKELYNGDKKKSFRLLYLQTFFDLNYILWGKATGTFFFYRISEGKGILGNLILPSLLLLFLKGTKQDRLREWFAFGLIVISSFSICMSSVFLLPVTIGCLMVSGLIQRKKIIIPCSVCLLWCILMFWVYILLDYGIIKVPI